MTAGPTRDWAEWHQPYDNPASPLSRRLATVVGHIVAWADAARPGPLTVLSMCAGQGRDLVQALDGHRRAGDVRALLVEADARNVAYARQAAAAAGLDGVEVVEGDASVTDAYAAVVPADLLLVCGVFGNISDGDIDRTIAILPTLCAEGATVIWTRHRRPPDRTPAIRERFAACGFAEVAFDAPVADVFGVGVHRLAAAPEAFAPGVSLFEFVGDGSLPA